MYQHRDGPSDYEPESARSKSHWADADESFDPGYSQQKLPWSEKLPFDSLKFLYLRSVDLNQISAEKAFGVF